MKLLTLLASIRSGELKHTRIASFLTQLAIKNGKTNWTGGILQATHFPGRTTPCSIIHIPFGPIHPKNAFFVAEKTWRLWENGDQFASQSADLIRNSYEGIPWEDLRNFKFAGALRIHNSDESVTILSFSGLPPWLDEAVVYCWAKMFEKTDSLIIPPYSNNPVLETTMGHFEQNRNLFV